MDFMLDIPIKPPHRKIGYKDKLLVMGSCFTEHIGGRLQQLKFSVLQNPNGILFDPLSVAESLESYVTNKQYRATDLFFLNELWQSWQHHSVFSGLNQDEVLEKINMSQKQAHDFLREADWLIITLGSSFHYQLETNGQAVANCHRAPAKWFRKRLISIDETVSAMNESIRKLLAFNEHINLMFTISPVRHIRDGVTENNRSKARLVEAVHQLVNKYEHACYFPAYEIVIDVLRDYRFYDIDLVHPNYAATEFVFEKFTENYIYPESRKLMEEIRSINTAFNHKPFQPQSKAHEKFLETYREKIQQVKQNHSHINLDKELLYFSANEKHP